MPARIPAVLASVALVAGLAGCATADARRSSAERAADSACAASQTGSVVDRVAVRRGSGSVPEVEFDAPVRVDSAEGRIVSMGAGRPLADDDRIEIRFAGYNGDSGTAVASRGFEDDSPQPTVVDPDRLPPGLYPLLLCSRVGSRILLVMPDREVAAGRPSRNVILLVDVRSAHTATPARWTDDVPAVDLSADPPTVAVPTGAPPTELRVAAVEDGDGPVVGAGDVVGIEYRCLDWETGEPVDEDTYTWGEGPLGYSAENVIPGYEKALIGRRVGSTLLVAVPAGDVGEGDDEVVVVATDIALLYLIRIRSAAEGY